MNSWRTWFWEIKELGQGPDYVFIATFAEADAARLALLVQQHLPATYVPNTEFILSARRGENKVYSNYLDRHTHDFLMKQKEAGEKQNIYFHGEIEVRDNKFCIENVLSGGMYDETSLVIALAQAPDLTLHEWIVAYSGYSWGEVARGSCAAELLAYLQYQE